MGYDKQPKKVRAEFYVTVEPVWMDAWYKDENNERVLKKAKAVGLTQRRPIPHSGVVTKLILEFDATTFLPLRPEAVITVPPGAAEIIVATANDPREGDDG